MSIEIDILGHSCDVVRHGSLLKTASIRLPLSVLISRDSAKSLRTLIVKLLRNERLRSQISRGRRQKKDTALARCRGGQRAWRKEEDFVSIGEPFSRHSRKARGITSMKIFCDMFNKLLMTSVGLLIRLRLMTSLL